jgi:hypothetical protein
VEGGLEDPDPELEDPPVDVEPEEPDELVGGLEEPEELVGGLEEPEELVGGLEEPDELVGGLEVVGGVGGGARRSTEVFTDPLKEAVAPMASRPTSVKRKRILFYIDT